MVGALLAGARFAFAGVGKRRPYGEAIEREEVEQPAEELRALGDADDGFGLERVQGPEERGQKGRVES